MPCGREQSSSNCIWVLPKSIPIVNNKSDNGVSIWVDHQALNIPQDSNPHILDSYIGHVGGEAQKNILSILLCPPAIVGLQHFLMIPDRLVGRQEYTAPVNQAYSIIACIVPKLHGLSI